MPKDLRLFVVLLMLLGLNSCRGHLPEAPRVDICVHSIENKGFVCIRPDDTDYFISYEQAPNYIAQSPNDAEVVNQYVLRLEEEVSKCRKP